MVQRGKPVQSSIFSCALEYFIEGNCAILTRHSIKSYDCYVLANIMEAVEKMGVFLKYVAGFVDRELLLMSQFPGFPLYNQTEFSCILLHCVYAAHDDLQDVTFLQRPV